jgi:hypothetical protein
MLFPGPFLVFIINYIFWLSHFFFVYSLLLCAMLVLLKPLVEAFLFFLVLTSKLPLWKKISLPVYNWNLSACLLSCGSFVLLAQSLLFAFARTPCFAGLSACKGVVLLSLFSVYQYFLPFENMVLFAPNTSVTSHCHAPSRVTRLQLLPVTSLEMWGWFL